MSGIDWPVWEPEISMDEFIESNIGRGFSTRADLLSSYVILPCRCSGPDCKGWAKIWRDERDNCALPITRHMSEFIDAVFESEKRQ